MSTKTAIIIAVTMAVLSWVHDTVRVSVSIRPEPARHEAAAPTAVRLSASGMTLHVPADGGSIELRIDRVS